MKKHILKAVLLLSFFAAGHASSDQINFVGQGSNSRWSVNGTILDGDVTAQIVRDTLLIERDGGGRCEIQEDGFRYFPVNITYRISNGFVASNRSLVDESISLKMVFSRRKDTEISFVLPMDNTDEFSIRRRQADSLDDLSLTRGRTPDEYVVGFIKAMFSAKYYDELWKIAPENERALIERRRLYFAKIAANFLYQQHVQDSATNLFSNDPIILPDGDAYNLLLRILTTEGEAARNTVLGTRYRSFWFIRDRIENTIEIRGEIPTSLLVAAKTISECLLNDDGLRRIDPVLLDYLRENKVYVPASRDALMEQPVDEEFNMWRVIYQNRYGEIPRQYEYDDVLSKIFTE